MEGAIHRGKFDSFKEGPRSQLGSFLLPAGVRKEGRHDLIGQRNGAPENTPFNTDFGT